MNLITLGFSKISLLIKRKKEENRIEREQIFKEKREKLIKFLDHKWTKEEYDRYNNWFMLENEYNIGPYTSAEYQDRKLGVTIFENKGYLTESEIDKFKKDIKIRLLEEKRELLMSKVNDNQVFLSNIDNQIKELRKVDN